MSIKMPVEQQPKIVTCDYNGKRMTWLKAMQFLRISYRAPDYFSITKSPASGNSSVKK